MAPKSKTPAEPKPATKAAPAKKAKDAGPPSPLKAEREAALTAEAKALGENVLLFPGKLSRRASWSGKIHLAAERDAADLIRTPFHEDEPPLTQKEIDDLGDKLIFLRVIQSRWRGLLIGQKSATVNFEKPAAEAGVHKETLLRFFSLRYRNNPEGQKWLTALRAGSGDADLVQDVSDLLLRCKKEKKAIDAAPRGEAHAAARLSALFKDLSRLLAAKSLSDEAQEARKLRDAAYTLVMNTERRLRTAAEYWYGGTEKLKDYAAFPASAGGADEGDDANEDEPAAPDGAAAPTGGSPNTAPNT